MGKFILISYFTSLTSKKVIKIKILVKNANFGQQFQFWSTISILVKNINLGQKVF